MEPDRGDERVPDVHGYATAEGAFGGDTGEQPAIRQHPSTDVPGERRSDDGVRSIDVPGEPPTVFDLESRITADVDGVDFHEFWVESRDHVGRALALTLGNSDLAAEAVDEAMVRAYQRWPHVSQLDNPGGWVYRVGLNYARSRLRRLARKLTRHDPPPPEPQVVEPSIVRALDRLSVDHRSVVVCRLLLDWSEADTATALKIRPGTVKSRLSRALDELERHLGHLRPVSKPGTDRTNGD